MDHIVIRREAGPIVMIAVCGGLMIAAAACGGAAQHRAAGGGHPVKPARVAAARVTASRPIAARPGPARHGPTRPSPVSRRTDYDGPHFATPAAAMRYLAFAYDQHDNWALRQVTSGRAYKELIALRPQAVDFRFTSCGRYGYASGYSCGFTHDYPASLHRSGHGAASVFVTWGKYRGWYMEVLMDCG